MKRNNCVVRCRVVVCTYDKRVFQNLFCAVCIFPKHRCKYYVDANKTGVANLFLLDNTHLLIYFFSGEATGIIMEVIDGDLH